MALALLNQNKVML